MSEQHTPSFWTRLKRVFTGTPVSHDEARAARARHTQDVMTQTQLATRNQRFGGMSL
jgi:hypothetical protein